MIQTKQLTLHAYSDQDNEQLLSLLTNEIIKQTFMIPDVASEEEAQELLQTIKTLAKRKDHFEVGIYKDETLVGFINEVGRTNSYIELGYVIHPDVHGKGYATQALAAVIVYLFQQGFQEVRCGAFAHNQASIKVMEHCGMKRISLEEDIFYHNQLHHCIYYAIQKE